MRLRPIDKDNLKTRMTSVSLEARRDETPEDPLLFWTEHKSPSLVDLRAFALGITDSPKNVVLWRGGFSGRPDLIAELAIALRELLRLAAPKTVWHYTQGLRAWWRILDDVERRASASSSSSARVDSVADLGEIHYQFILDKPLAKSQFSCILVAVNICRKSLKLRPLYWQAPEPAEPIRILNPEWQVKALRIELKHRWFATLDRWEKAERLVEGAEATDPVEARLKRSYEMFDEAVRRSKDGRPLASEISNGMLPQTFTRRGFSVEEMLRGKYPDGEDVRIAFHLCVANTGWNPSTFTAMNVEAEFIEPHPKDSSRYLLRAPKERADGAMQMTEGLYKSSGSAGVILQTLIARTRPLREKLRTMLSAAEREHLRLVQNGADSKTVNKARKRVIKLQRGVKSPWLYATIVGDGIAWLDSHAVSYARSVGDPERAPFLDVLVRQMNANRAPDKQISRIKASDFRDAFFCLPCKRWHDFICNEST